MQIKRSWEEAMANESYFFQTLGLSFHDLLDSGAHHRSTHSETMGHDAEDTDHGSSIVPQHEQLSMKPPRALLPLLKFPSQEPLGELFFTVK